MVTPKDSDRGTFLDVQIRNTLDQFITDMFIISQALERK